MNTVQEIERAIDALTPQQMEELCVWIDHRHPQPIAGINHISHAHRF